MADVLRYQMPGNPADYRLDPTVPGGHPIELGDLVYWDSTNRYLEEMAAGNGPSFVGISEGHGPTPTSQVDNAPGLVKAIRVQSKGIVNMKTTAADSLDHGDPLVIGADAQTVLKQTGEADTEIIGYVWNPEASAAVTGAVGVNIDMLLKANYPAVGLY